MSKMKYSGGAVIFQSEMQHQHQNCWGMQQYNYNRNVMGQHQNTYQQQADPNAYTANILTDSINLLQQPENYSNNNELSEMNLLKTLEQHVDFDALMAQLNDPTYDPDCVKYESQDSPEACTDPGDLASCCSSTESEKEEVKPAVRRRRPGARRKEELGEDLDYLSSPQDAQKRKRRREQNRQAARRCRERKKEQRQALVGEYYKLISENSQLQNQIKHMESENKRLQQLYSNHMLHCCYHPD